MVNQITLIGHLGGDPELTTLENGKSVARLSIATTEHWKDKSGEKQSATEWHKVEAWNGNADIASKFLKKGDVVHLQGKLKTEQWEDESTGLKRYQTKVVVTTFTLLPQKNTEGAASAEAKEIWNYIYSLPKAEKSEIMNGYLEFMEKKANGNLPNPKSV